MGPSENIYSSGRKISNNIVGEMWPWCMPWLLVESKTAVWPEDLTLRLNYLELDPKANFVYRNTERWIILILTKLLRSSAPRGKVRCPRGTELKAIAWHPSFVCPPQWGVARSDTLVKSTEEASPRSTGSSGASPTLHVQAVLKKEDPSDVNYFH